jgi:putative drug exporter of the RND superfamily
VFRRLGRLVTRHPWWVIGIWVVAAVVIVLVAPSLSSVASSDQAGFLPDKYDSALAQKVAEREFPQTANATSVFVIKRDDGGKLTTADKLRVALFVARLNAAKLEHVAAVVTGPTMVAPNGKAQLVTVVHDGPIGDQTLQDGIPALRDAAANLLHGSGLQEGLTGAVAIGYDAMNAFTSAQNMVAIGTIILILVLLGLIFRSPIAGLMPVLAIGLVYALSTSLIALLAKGLDFKIDQSVTSLLIVVLFGIGTDYVLFLLFRFRERLRAGDERRAAIVTSVSRVGRAIASSGFVVVAAMMALLLSELKSFQTLAPVFVVSVVVMLLASLTLIPALLMLLGSKVFWPSRNWHKEPKGRFWKGLSGQIARHPGRMALASGGLLVAIACGMLFITIDYNVTGSMPADTLSSVATKSLETSFPAGAMSPTQVYMTSSKSLGRAELAKVRAKLAGVPGVATVSAPVLSQAGTTALFTVNLKDAPMSNEALNVANDLRDTAHALAAPGQQLVVGGQTMAFAELRQASSHDYKVVFPVAALLILLILFLLLRSIIAPLYLLAGVWLGYAATLGASVIAFQLIGSDPGLMFMMPMICYLFVVAMGTDYNILLTSRLREEIIDGATPHNAAALAVLHGGPTVASAGIIFAGTFCMLMVTGITLLAEMGFAVAVGILLVAIVMAAILMPSIATLLGHKVWWPGHQDDPTRAPKEDLPDDTEEAVVPAP